MKMSESYSPVILALYAQWSLWAEGVKPLVKRAPALGWGRVMGSQYGKSSSIGTWQGILEVPSATNSFYST